MIAHSMISSGIENDNCIILLTNNLLVTVYQPNVEELPQNIKVHPFKCFWFKVTGDGFSIS